MQIVLKNIKNLEEKVNKHAEEAASRNDNYLILHAANSIIKEVTLTVRGMNLGWVEYGPEQIFVSNLGVYIQIKPIDKYV